MSNIRRPNVAGQFYPRDAKVLEAMIRSFLGKVSADIEEMPKAIIAPHAGYVYSGPIAATIFAILSRFRKTIKKVVLFGPSHRVYFHGIAQTSADYFETPLGVIPVARERDVLPSSIVHVNEAPFGVEHSLEVQLPFLQTVLDGFELIPLIVGDVEFSKVADLMTGLWGGKETLIVVSSDLSHYLDYQTAQKLDAHTSQAIMDLAPHQLSAECACGFKPIQGLLQVGRRLNMRVRALDVRNSGDTAGSKESVVGYGAYCFWESQ
jgi:MEMO1 family protein